MNKYNFLFSLTLLFLIMGCKKESILNDSGIRLSSEYNFVVSSIQPGPDNQILCVGTIRDSDSTIVRRYDQSLNFIELHEISKIPEFKGELVLKYIKNTGWLISSIERNPDFTTLTVYKTDEQFRIQNKRELVKMKNINSSYRGYINVYEEVVLANDDFVVVCDTVSWVERSSGGIGNDYGIKLYCLDPDLNLKYRPFSGGDNAPTNSFEPLAVELEDGSLFYYFYGSSMVYSGILEQNGDQRFQNERKPESPQSKSISMTKFGSNILLNTTVTNVKLQYYTVLDPSTGSIINQSSLPTNTINEGLVGPNPLSMRNENNLGHVLYSEDKKKLKFMSVDQNLNLTNRFEVFLPKFNNIFSYRQMFMDNGNILIGISYEYQGKEHFNLQEVNINGEIVK